MKLIPAIIAKFADTPALAAFRGTAPSGAVGPFKDIAPDRTPKPYVRFSLIPGAKRAQGFGTSATATVRHIKFDVYAANADTLDGYMTTLQQTFDRVVLTLDGGATTKPAFIDEPYYTVDEGVGPDQQHVYRGTLVVRFIVTNSIGSEA